MIAFLSSIGKKLIYPDGEYPTYPELSTVRNLERKPRPHTPLAYRHAGEKAPVRREVMLCVQNSMSGVSRLVCKTKLFHRAAAMEDVQHIFDNVMTGMEISKLNTRLLSGGRRADKALARLKTLVARPYAKKMMKALGTANNFVANPDGSAVSVTAFVITRSALSSAGAVLSFLMKRSSTPDRYGRGRATSKRLTRQATQAAMVGRFYSHSLATDIADTASGGFGHVNVVLPRPSRVRRADRAMKELQQGMV
ncbi:hypothetical protein CSUI_002710 [Cystoisospora suis]|uniref:Uncharacterized protein n=1 Tax=Cystoisospora suis TaxID=483139 RepID=A0A2C6L8B8_9APIC|nr:hypothetical protein CSUI_002710 [Cystoisospora suis]